MTTLSKLETGLSQEWNKPKAQNIKEKQDDREARSYKRIKELQDQISKIKNKPKLDAMQTKKDKQKEVLKRLEDQLKADEKTKKGSQFEKVPLTEKDKRRIQKEIEILKDKI